MGFRTLPGSGVAPNTGKIEVVVRGFESGASEEVIWRRVQKLTCAELSGVDVAAMTELVSEAQDAVHTIASSHIQRTLESQSYFKPKFRDRSEIEAESAQRAK